MKLRMLSLAAGVMLVAGAVLTFSASVPAQAKELSKQEIEQIVHDYILNHPEVLVQAGEKIKQQEVAKAKAEKANALKELLANGAIPTSGPADATHTIVEFFDYNCGYCKRAKPVFMQVLNKYPKTKYVYVEFPILSEISGKAARIGLAVYQMDPAKYVEYHNELMTRQGRLSDEITLQALVEKLGFKWDEVKALSEKPEVGELIRQIRVYAQKMEVTGTPVFIIDGQELHGAPTDISAVEALLK